MENNIIFLDVDDVLEIHNIAIEKYGGQDGVRDYNLLDSAINQVRQTFGGQFLYNTIETMAAIYAYHIAENQPFIDGNKRTAFASSSVFLKLNGYRLLTNNEEVYNVFINLANKKIDKDYLVLWYKEKIKKQ